MQEKVKDVHNPVKVEAENIALSVGNNKIKSLKAQIESQRQYEAEGKNDSCIGRKNPPFQTFDGHLRPISNTYLQLQLQNHICMASNTYLKVEGKHLGSGLCIFEVEGPNAPLVIETSGCLKLLKRKLCTVEPAI